MTGLLIIAGAVFALVAAAYVYWVLLMIRYPEPALFRETHTVKTADLWQIQLFRQGPPKGGGEPVFLCHGAFGNHFNFCYPRGESLVDALVGKGYDCWLIDLRGCRSAVPAFGRTKQEPDTDDHLLRDIPAALDYIQKVTGYAQVHWIGHSMGGMFLYAYDCVFGPDRIASGTTLGSPLGFKGVPYKNQRYLLPLFRLARPAIGIFLRELVPILANFEPKSMVFPVNWRNVHPKIDGGYFFHGIDVLPPGVAEDLDFWASNKVWHAKDHQVDVLKKLPTLRVPLLGIYGASDPLVPVAEAKRFFKKLANRDKQLLILSKANGHSENYSHIDLLFAPKGKDEVYAPIAAWLKKHPIGRGAAKTTRKRAASAKKAVLGKTKAKASAKAKRQAAKPKKAGSGRRRPARKK